MTSTSDTDAALWRRVTGVILRECPICYAVVDHPNLGKHAAWHTTARVTPPDVGNPDSHEWLGMDR